MYKYFTNRFFIGKKALYLPSCQSTNDLASQFISQNLAQEGFVVYTSFQDKGKGQRGSVWESDIGQNLILSLVCRPMFLSLSNQFMLHTSVALGIQSFLDEVLPGVGFTIKWPNDIYYKDRKLAGTLIENIIKKNKMDFSVVGIGLNVNQLLFKTPNAVSLQQISGKVYDLDALLECLLEHLDKYYAMLVTGQFETLKSRYTENLYRYQKLCWFKDLRHSQHIGFNGEILGVNKNGKLAIRREDTVEYFGLKEVAYLNNNSE